MKEPPDCHDQRKSQIEDDAIARAEELEGERTITKYLEQKLHTPGEHSLCETIDNAVALRARVAQLESERSDLYYWFEHRHVTGTFTLEQIDAMSIREMADHAYERKAEQAEQLTRERDEAIKEANRRDEKWMSGISEIIGSKLDYQDPCTRNNASKALGDLVRERDDLVIKLAHENMNSTTILSALKECVGALEGVDSVGFCECDDQYGEGKCLWCECKSALTKAQEALR